MSALKLKPIKREDAVKALHKMSGQKTWLANWERDRAAAFSTAKSMWRDVLGDIGKSVEDAIVAGETYETWSKKLIPALKENGWWGATSQ